MTNLVRLGIVLVVVSAILIVDITPKKTAASKAAFQEVTDGKATETVSKITSHKGSTNKTAASKVSTKKGSTTKTAASKAASQEVTDGKATETVSKITSHKGSTNKTAASKVSTKKGSTNKTGASKTSTKKKSSKSHTKKAPSQDEAPSKLTSQTDSVQDVAPPKDNFQEVSVENPVPPAPISPVNSFFNSPQAASMLSMLQTGKKPTTGELLTLMLPNILDGAKKMNPALASVASAMNETALALNASKDGTLSTGQMMIYSNKMLTALGEATDTPKQNMPKVKTCMASGMRTYNSSDFSTVFGILNNCSKFFGNGTASGDAGVMVVMSAFLPPGLGSIITNPGVQDVMKAVGGLVSQVAGNSGKKDGAANVDAPGLINSLGSMMKGAGLNLDMNAVGGIVSQVSANQGKKDEGANVDAPSLMNSLGSMAKGAGVNIDFGQLFSNFKFGR